MIFFFLYIRFVVYFFGHTTQEIYLFLSLLAHPVREILCFFARPCVSFTRLYLPSLASHYMNVQCYLFAFHSVGGALAILCRRVAFAIDTGTTAIFGTRSRLSSTFLSVYVRKPQKHV